MFICAAIKIVLTRVVDSEASIEFPVATRNHGKVRVTYLPCPSIRQTGREEVARPAMGRLGALVSAIDPRLRRNLDPTTAWICRPCRPPDLSEVVPTKDQQRCPFLRRCYYFGTGTDQGRLFFNVPPAMMERKTNDHYQIRWCFTPHPAHFPRGVVSLRRSRGHSTRRHVPMPYLHSDNVTTTA